MQAQLLRGARIGRNCTDILWAEMGRHRRELVVSLAALCVLATACSSTAAPSGKSSGTAVVVTPSAVPKIVAAYSSANNRSNAALSTADQATDEQGSALALDDAAYALQARAGFKTADGKKYYPFSLVPLEVSVPRQAGYPARFESLLRTQSSPGTPAGYACAGGSQVDVFVKDSASAPWRAALEPEVTTSLVPKLAGGSGGFAPAVLPAQARQAAAVPASLATALEAYARTGKLSDGLTESDFGTAHKCWSIDNLRADVLSEAGNHVVETVSVSQFTPSDLSVVPLSDGAGTLALFSLDIRATFKPQMAGYAIRWPHSASNPLEDVVPAGAYSSITMPEICEIAAIDPAPDAGSPSPRIIGADCGPLVGSGKKASPGQIVPSGPPSSALYVNLPITP